MRISLRVKSIIVIVIFALFLSGVMLSVTSTIINNLVDRDYMKQADELAATVAAVTIKEPARRLNDAVLERYHSIDPDDRISSEEWGTTDFNSYIARFSDFEKDPDFLTIRDNLRMIQELNSVNCLYLATVDAESRTVIYLVDADPEEPCPPGCFDPLYEINYDLLTDPERGFPAYITDTEDYGWLVTAGAPVRDRAGRVICYAMVDIDMEDIRADQRSYVLLCGGIMLVLTILISILGYVLVEKFAVRPLRELSEAAKKYCREEKSNIRHGFAALQIRNNDEIGDLADSMKQMENDFNEYYTNLLGAEQEIQATREQAMRINEIANMDALTGIRNKRAYDFEAEKIDEAIAGGFRDFGIVVSDLNNLKRINDKYGHEMGDISIKMLSENICGVFKHSPVFRYGGDEFVVIIRDNDLKNIEKLIEEFEKETENIRFNDRLSPWQQISAAIGYAVFDTELDKNVADVFKRADNEMYICKKRMKSL
ncbi:MAG: GGDEF domain-containing protein [Lachnospiraceae bacterium]|nr:GGDEF domain-containing protein [Lachnospiraceae bacterium]